jgi:hypothetical protein
MAKARKKKDRASQYSYKRIDVWLSNEAVAMADRMDDNQPDRTEALRSRLIKKLHLLAERLRRISHNERISARGEWIARNFCSTRVDERAPDLEARRAAEVQASHLSTLQRQSWHERLARLLEGYR